MPRRRSDEEQKTLYGLWRQSNLTGTEFCKQNHISSHSLWRWKRKFGTDVVEVNKADLSPIKDIRFYPVGEVGRGNGSFLEIFLPRGISCKVHLPESGINNFLQELLK